MKNGLLNEMDKALGLSPSPPQPPPAKQPAGMMAAARQLAALQADIQGLQARLLQVEQTLIGLSKSSATHSDWIKKLDARTKKIAADARPWWKKLTS